jgi:hypothetical protein
LIKSLLSIPAIVLFCTLAASAGSSTSSSSTSHMPTCKGPVVYAVAADKIYYVKGETMYGHAKGGSYMCEATANSKGYHKM